MKRRRREATLGHAQVLTTDLQPLSFAATVLPLTMGLGAALRTVLADGLPKSSASWPFGDRLLAWLLPTLSTNIENFHSSNGPPMLKLFSPDQVESIDLTLFQQLVQQVQRSNPVLLMWLADVVLAIREAGDYSHRWDDQLLRALGQDGLSIP